MPFSRCLIVFGLILLAGVEAPAAMLPLQDAGGAVRDSLLTRVWGDEVLVAWDDLTGKAGWETATEGQRYTVDLPDLFIELFAENAFVRTGRRYRQLRVVPVMEAGKLWVPVSALEELLPGFVERNADGSLQLPQWREAEAAWMLRTVIIDPGHGGKDPGALGLWGLQEKTLTLDVSLRLAALLREQGVRVELTREFDEFMTLDERTAFANEQQGDLFISIHCNSHADSSVHGLETYFLSVARTARAVDAAVKENSVVHLETNGQSYAELTDENFILLTMATSQYLRDSESLAALALTHLQRNSGLTSRGVDQAGFYVLMGAAMPAVLVECGYLSNPRDAHILSSEPGREKIAKALAASIVEFKTKLESSATR